MAKSNTHPGTSAPRVDFLKVQKLYHLWFFEDSPSLRWNLLHPMFCPWNTGERTTQVRNHIHTEGTHRVGAGYSPLWVLIIISVELLRRSNPWRVRDLLKTTWIQSSHDKKKATQSQQMSMRIWTSDIIGTRLRSVSLLLRRMSSEGIWKRSIEGG